MRLHLERGEEQFEFTCIILSCVAHLVRMRVGVRVRVRVRVRMRVRERVGVRVRVRVRVSDHR